MACGGQARGQVALLGQISGCLPLQECTGVGISLGYEWIGHWVKRVACLLGSKRDGQQQQRPLEGEVFFRSAGHVSQQRMLGCHCAACGGAACCIGHL